MDGPVPAHASIDPAAPKLDSAPLQAAQPPPQLGSTFPIPKMNAAIAKPSAPPPGVPSFPSTHPQLDEIIMKLRNLGPDGPTLDPNAMIKRVSNFISQWWEQRYADQVFYTLSFMLEKLGSTNQSIEINSLQNCFSLAMQRPGYWSPRQLEMLKHIKAQLDKLSSDVSQRTSAGMVSMTNAQHFPANQPNKRLNKPTPPASKVAAPVKPPVAPATAPVRNTAAPPKSTSNFVELFYCQMDAMNSNLYDVHERMTNLDRRLGIAEKLQSEMAELRREMARLNAALLAFTVPNAALPAAAPVPPAAATDSKATKASAPQRVEAESRKRPAVDDALTE